MTETNQSDARSRAAKVILEEVPVPEGEELKALVRELKGALEYGVARKLLAKARKKEPTDIWVVQQLALCTYKDEELLPANRFSDALELLEEIGLLSPDEAVASGRVEERSLPETLALGGAVYKRKWEQGGQLENLHQALAFYRSAWERNPEMDAGYGGVNAAYILDILVSRARTVAVRVGTKPQAVEDFPEVKGLRTQARKLRERILETLPKVAEEKLKKEKRDLP